MSEVNNDSIDTASNTSNAEKSNELPKSEIFDTLKKKVNSITDNLKLTLTGIKKSAPEVNLSEELNSFQLLAEQLDKMTNETEFQFLKKPQIGKTNLSPFSIGKKGPSFVSIADTNPHFHYPYSTKEHLVQVALGGSPMQSTDTNESINPRNLKKVGEQKGTNEGGFYEDEQTGEKLYLKFYQNINQGRMENLANHIYRKLGIAAPESEIVQVGERLAFASKIIEGHHRMSPEEIKSDESIKEGFIADAFLANWDVIGLVFDNLERGSDGKKYRIDNGGALTYRAQGGTKAYPADSLDEINSLRNPNINNRTASVFSNISEEQMKSQALNLITNLTEDDIDMLVTSAELPKELDEIIRSGMKGRRKVLIERFGLEELSEQDNEEVGERFGKQRAAEAIERLREKKKSEQLEGMFESIGILGDSDKIEGHQIDFIFKGDRTVVTFKMTPNMLKKVTDTIIPALTSDQITDGSYSFQSTSGEVNSIADCWVIKIDDNTSIYISKGSISEYASFTSYDFNKPKTDNEGNIYGYEEITEVKKKSEIEMRALLGAVQIEVKGITDVNEIATRIDTAFNQISINKALEKPETDAEKKYKKAIYRWQHRLEKDSDYTALAAKFQAENGLDIVDHLKRKEVFPGYQTIVDSGASERYQQEGKLLLIHNIYNEEHVESLLTNGLISSHERYKRGLFTTGKSTERDFETGGADNVFLRCVPENVNFAFYRPTLLIDPAVMDRLDWFAYKIDNFGTTAEKEFNGRPSIDNFINSQRIVFNSTNEMMFRRGIPPEMFIGLMVRNENEKNRILKALSAKGINEFNGRPLDEFIQIRHNTKELYNNGTKPDVEESEPVNIIESDLSNWGNLPIKIELPKDSKENSITSNITDLELQEFQKKIFEYLEKVKNSQ